MNKKIIIIIIIIIFLFTNSCKKYDRYKEENIKKFIETKKNNFKKTDSIKKYRNVLSIVSKSEMITKNGIKYKENLFLPFIIIENKNEKSNIKTIDLIKKILSISTLVKFSKDLEIEGKKVIFGFIIVFGKHINYGLISGWMASGISKQKMDNILKKKESLIKTIKKDIKNIEIHFKKFKAPVCEKSFGCGGTMNFGHLESRVSSKILEDLEKKILKDKHNLKKIKKILRKKLFTKKEFYKNENQPIFYELNK